MRQVFLYFVGLVVIVLDQYTKIAILDRFAYGEVLEVVPGLFNLTLVMNPGAAFGLFSGLPDFWRRIVLGVVTFFAVVLVLVLLKKEAKDDHYAQLGLYLVLGGAIGNLIDRFRFDAVVDFLDFYYGNYHWPAFNVADSAISVGVTLLMFRFVFFPVHKSDKEPSTANQY
ncbi:MAG TPA: signal peptidase II [Oligoflexia bacterium]|nr:signal peptidase II [Oligoflexia bacterium]HMP48258.1 signal peptidase II [Oligoflexia bacterium]